MSKYRFSSNQRFAVYMAFDGICQWCRRPLFYWGFNVDHVIPESLLGNQMELERIFATYGLPASFEINNYENWVPMHSFCNQLKSDSFYQDAGIIRTILDNCARRKVEAQQIELTFKLEPKKAELYAYIENLMERAFMTVQGLEDFILRKDVMDSEDERLNEIRRKLEESINHKAQMTVQQILDMAKSQFEDEVRAICKGLGEEWETFVSYITPAFSKDKSQTHLYKMVHSKNHNLTAQIFFNRNYSNNKLIILLTSSHAGQRKMKYDINKKIDWVEMRKVSRDHFIEEINAILP